MQFIVVTLFPDEVRTLMSIGVVGRAVECGLIAFDCVNPRDFAEGRHRRVDERPYGGGPGMVMQYAPMVAAIRAARDAAGSGARVIGLGPQGHPFSQSDAGRLADESALIFVAGRYEGIDERVADAEFDEELSLGDFVLSGGEIAALAMIDAIARRIDGVLGDADSAREDSFEDSVLDCPHYTRPAAIEGREVPQVLLDGDHAAISRWRRKQALGRTLRRRPDLLDAAGLEAADRQLLEEYLREAG